jgi:hypothetical protein
MNIRMLHEEVESLLPTSLLAYVRERLLKPKKCR